MSGDCCSANCTFETAGSTCTGDGNVCTDDKCDGDGACTHPNNTAGCDDNDVCTENDVCDGNGTCAGSGVCGDGQIQTLCDEQCDGVSLGNCRNGCEPNCTCSPGCGDGNVDAGEACDPPGSAACPGQPGEAPTICDANCQCPCPAVVSFEGDGSANALDTGFTGQSHDAKVIGQGILTVTIGNCNSSVRPCGQCDITGGPIPNREFANNQRCASDTSVECTADSDCSGVGGTCEFFFGGPLPLSAGAVPACVINQVNGTISGTVNVEAGSSDNETRLISRVFNGIVSDRPCATCEGDVTPFDGVRNGTCNGGARDGLTCDATGQHAFFGNTSFDCPPESGANIGNLDILLAATTGTQTKNITAASPKCTAVGFKSLKCMCSTCTTAKAEACFTDADCPASANCGGKRCIGGTQNGIPCSKGSDCDSGVCNRPGEATKPNSCGGGATDCAFVPSDTDSVDEGHCRSGNPFDSLCNIETFRGCSVDADCPVAGDTCGGKIRECFTTDGTTTGDTDVIAAGSPDVPVNDISNPKLATMFCIAPTTAPAINSVAGLPGLGRLSLPGTAKGY